VLVVGLGWCVGMGVLSTVVAQVIVPGQLCACLGLSKVWPCGLRGTGRYQISDSSYVPSWCLVVYTSQNSHQEPGLPGFLST
jgi:hypothetical protein